MNEPHMLSIFVYHINIGIQEIYIPHLLDSNNSKVHDSYVRLHKFDKKKSFKIVIYYYDINKAHLLSYGWREYVADCILKRHEVNNGY